MSSSWSSENIKKLVDFRNVARNLGGEEDWKDELINSLIERVNSEIAFLREEVAFLREESRMKNKVLNAVMSSGLFSRSLHDSDHAPREQSQEKTKNNSNALSLKTGKNKELKSKNNQNKSNIICESFADRLSFPLNGKRNEKWPKGTICLLGNSIVSELISNLPHENSSSLPATNVDELFHYMKPIVKKNPSVMILDVGTNKLVRLNITIPRSTPLSDDVNAKRSSDSKETPKESPDNKDRPLGNIVEERASKNLKPHTNDNSNSCSNNIKADSSSSSSRGYCRTDGRTNPSVPNERTSTRPKHLAPKTSPETLATFRKDLCISMETLQVEDAEHLSSSDDEDDEMLL